MSLFVLSVLLELVTVKLERNRLDFGSEKGNNLPEEVEDTDWDNLVWLSLSGGSFLLGERT